jgi:hypothetical protein
VAYLLLERMREGWAHGAELGPAAVPVASRYPSFLLLLLFLFSAFGVAVIYIFTHTHTHTHTHIYIRI